MRFVKKGTLQPLVAFRSNKVIAFFVLPAQSRRVHGDGTLFFYSSLSPRRRREKERLHVFFPLFSSRLLLDGHATDVAAVALQLAALLQVRGQAREFVAVDVELLQQVQLSQLRGKRGELVVAQVPPPESIPSHSHSPPPFIRQT